MKRYFKATFRWYNTNTYCTNMALAESVEDVRAHYSKHEVISISEASPYELKEAELKGMPIIHC